MGKTQLNGHDTDIKEKHPHVHGEDYRTFGICFIIAETPPRAWGRPRSTRSTGSTVRNTPTCMGKTPLALLNSTDILETPPRAWGRLDWWHEANTGARNTPTCMGKTRNAGFCFFLSWKHPHVHGEDNISHTKAMKIKETPPRAWGRLVSVAS